MKSNLCIISVFEIAALSVLIGSTVPLSAEESKIQVLSGKYQLSGGGVGCADINGTHYIIAFGKTLDKVPAIVLETTVDAPQDSLQASIIQVAADHVEVAATANGRNGHQICAGTYLHWTASY